MRLTEGILETRLSVTAEARQERTRRVERRTIK